MRDRAGRLYIWGHPGAPEASRPAHQGAVLRLRTSPKGPWSTAADGGVWLGGAGALLGGRPRTG